CPDAGHRRGPGRRFGNMADDADSAFTGFAAATVEGLLERHPEWATSVGDHRYDDRLTVGTAGHYAETSRWAGERLAGHRHRRPVPAAPGGRADPGEPARPAAVHDRRAA